MLITDIRYYENPGRTVFGNLSYQSFGTIFSIPFRSFPDIGDRFACKLRECGFELPGFDHLDVILTPALAAEKAELSAVSLDKRARFVDVGLSPDYWDKLSDNEKHDHLVNLTAEALLATNSGHQKNLIETVSTKLKEIKSEIEIKLKTKDTLSYRVEVSFQVSPNQNSSVAYIIYTDKASGHMGRGTLSELKFYDDIYKLCGSIIVRSREIVISPKPSFRASLVAKRYETPFTLSIDELLAPRSVG